MSAEEFDRPDNAPPSYDEAVRQVNDAFAYDDDDEDAPPIYSLVPTGEGYARSEEESQESRNEGDTSCGCNTNLTTTSTPRSKCPKPIEENHDDNNNFHHNLPKDPPPYIENPSYPKEN